MSYTYVTTMNPLLPPVRISHPATFIGKSALHCALINESSSERAIFGRLGASAMNRIGVHALGGGSPASTALAATLCLVETWGIPSLQEGRRFEEGLEVGVSNHQLGRCPPTYAANANEIVSEPFQKEQCSNMQCQRPKQRIAGDSTLLIGPACMQISIDKVD
jgi:hypothetical protein